LNIRLYSDTDEIFEFLIGGEFLRLSLDEHLQEKSLSSVWINLYIYFQKLCIYFTGLGYVADYY